MDERPLRVLLVDDDEDDYFLTRDLLAGIRGRRYELEWVADFDAALAALGQHRHDVALIDYDLGERFGLDLVREATGRGCTAPLILLTGRGNHEVDVAAMEAGAADYLDKGEISTPLLERALRYALQRRRSEEELQRAHDELEDRVRERTAELVGANEALVREAAERRRAEGELKASEKRFRSLSTSSPVGIFQADADGRADYANERCLAILGLTLEELLGHGWSRAVHPEDREAVLEDWLAAAGDGREFSREYRVVTPAGEVRWVYVRAATLPADDGGHVGYVGTLMEVTERKRAEQEIRGLNAQLEVRLERLTALRRIDRAITASHDLRVTLDTVLDQVTSQLGVDTAAVLLLDPHTQELTHAAGRGSRGRGLARARLRLGEGLAGRAALERRTVSVADLREAGEAFAPAHSWEDDGFLAYHAVPLVAKGQVKGVLEVFHRGSLEPDPEWLDFLEALAGQTAIAVEGAALFDDLQRSNLELSLAYDATIEGWSRALDLRDKETEGHSRRVTEMTLRLARALGMTEAELVHVRRGALLHDIGKMGVPDAILLKPGPLTDEEWQVMRRHPGYAHEWLSPIPYLRPALDIPHCHHERWDGSGYPRGLAGGRIPPAARAFAAVDIWDALRSDRPYRKGWPDEQVHAHLRSLAGTHLDPEVVEVFLRILAEDAGSRVGPSEAAVEMVAGPSAEMNPSRLGTEGARLAALECTVAALTVREESLAEQLRRAAARNRRLEEQQEGLARQNARLVELAATDDLTGLKNRRHFREALESAFSLAIRQGQPLSVALLDVDHFKSYNDAHGHPAGDEVLFILAGILREQMRTYDLAARHGGEEFAILLPATDAPAARAFAERLRAAIAGRDWPHRPVTASLGIATMSSTLLAAIELVEEADRALFHSKQRGRDRVTHCEDLTASSAGHVSVGA